MILKKIQDYEEYIGVSEDNIAFSLFFSDFTKRAEKRIEELKNKTALVVFKDNFISRVIRKIKRLFKNSENEYQK